VDVDDRLSRMEQLLAEARPVPLSASVMVNRQDFDDLIAEIRGALPEELRQARWIIKEREDLLAQASREAEQIIADATAERDRLVSETEVVRAARREAERIMDDAREQARVLRLEAEDYVDGKLANFEIVLQKTLAAVERGRDRLRGRLASDDLAEGGAQEAPGAQLYDHEAAFGEREA
jgi:cell division septum initiation protein DivIVA